MRANISEFSFGYALTEAIIASVPAGVTAAPIFPSLIEEGTLGYDVAIQFATHVLFLQFKVSDQMVKGTAKESKDPPHFAVPFYRMHLRPLRYSDQHQLLLDAEANGKIVAYAAPRFYEEADFHTHYTTKQILNKSIFIRPSSIGGLDDADHHVSFTRDGAQRFVCSSEPKRLEQGVFLGAEFWKLAMPTPKPHAKPLGEGGYNGVANDLLTIVRDRRPRSGLARVREDDALAALRQQVPTHRFMAIVSQTYFDCTPLAIGRVPQP